MIVLVGDTRSHKNVALLKGLGWGRMRVLNMTKPFEGEPWALDNGAFGAWRGRPTVRRGRLPQARREGR